MRCYAYQKLGDSFLLIGLIACVLMVIGCRTDDQCKDACQHGQCIDNQCICEPAYEGEGCNTLSADKFAFPFWHNQLLCQSSSYYTTDIQAVVATPGAVDIFNLYLQGDSLRALAHQDSLIVPEQVYGVDYIEGLGIYVDGTVSIEFDVRSTGGQRRSCVAILSR